MQSFNYYGLIKNFGFQLHFFHCCQTNSNDPVSILFCHHSVSLLSLFSFCHQSVSLIRSSVLGIPANPLLHPVSPQAIHLYSFSLLASMDKFISQNGENQLLKDMESPIPHAKLGFATTAKCSTPTGKQSTKLPKITRTMKSSFLMTSGDRTIIFMLSLLGLSSKHNQPVPLKSNSVQQISKEEIISPLEPLFHYCFNRRNLMIC